MVTHLCDTDLNKLVNFPPFFHRKITVKIKTNDIVEAEVVYI